MTTLERIARPRILGLILALVTLLVYLPTWRHEFINYDDPDYVQNNPIVQQGLTWQGVKWAFTTTHADNWHPLTWISHMLDCQLFGLDPGAQHLVSVGIHVANAVLIFLLFTRLSISVWPAAFAAAVFAWHPLRVESVAWIAERKDVLSVFFGLLSLLAYARFAREGKAGAFWTSFALFTMSVLAKPMLVTLPCILLLLDYWPFGRFQHRTAARLAVEKWPFFLAATGVCAATTLAQSREAIVPLAVYHLKYRLGNACIAYVWYLVKTAWPTNLVVHYTVQPHMAWGRAAADGLALAAITLAAWRCRKTKPYFLTGWLWFLGSLVPVIGLVQVGDQTTADRYTYFPVIGLLIVVGCGIQDAIGRIPALTRQLAVTASLILTACLLATSRQLSYWQDSLSLFSRAYALVKNDPLIDWDLGKSLEGQGQLTAAAASYREALQIVPNDWRIEQSLASDLTQLGETNEARIHYENAARLSQAGPP